MLMAMYILENGKMIMHMVREYIYTVMDHNTKENGLKIDSMGSVWRLGQMELSIREIISMGQRKEKDYLHGLMVHGILENSDKTK